MKLYLKAYKSLLIVAAVLLLFNTSLSAQIPPAFKHSTPETEGVSSAMIDSFVHAASQKMHEMHSFMLLRHGKVIAQGWWNPYSATLKHSMYSCSKSFTSTAVGFAVSEKLLTVNDKVISFSRNYCPIP